MCENETQRQDVARKLWLLIKKEFTFDEYKKFEDLYNSLCESTHNSPTLGGDEEELRLMTRAAKSLGLYDKIRSLISTLTNIN